MKNFGLYATMTGIVVLVLTAYIFIVQLLWNYVMPSVFNLSSVTFWQAGALLLLITMLIASVKTRN